MQNIVLADQVGQLIAGSLQTGLGTRDQNRAYVFFDLFAHAPFGFLGAESFTRTDEIVVLGRYHDGVDTQGFAVIIVFDGYLAFGVGTQIGHDLPFAANDGQFFENDVGENQRSGHELFGLVAGVTEHDPLVAGSLGLFAFANDAAVDVGRLFMDG